MVDIIANKQKNIKNGVLVAHAPTCRTNKTKLASKYHAKVERVNKKLDKYY